MIKPLPNDASSTHHEYRCHPDGYLEYKWILQELVFHPHQCLVSPSQRIYQTMKSANNGRGTAGDLVTRRKEEIREALEEQMDLGEEGLAEEDRFLLEINLDELDNSTGEEQTYWLLALRAARDARQLLEQQNNTAALGNQEQSGI